MLSKCWFPWDMDQGTYQHLFAWSLMRILYEEGAV